MCLICVHLEKDKMTPQEAFRALYEYRSEKGEEETKKHRRLVLQKIRNKLDNGHSIICKSEQDATLTLNKR